MTLYPNLIIDALRNVRYPGNGKNIVEAEMLEDDLRIDGMNVSFSIIFENKYFFSQIFAVYRIIAIFFVCRTKI